MRASLLGFLLAAAGLYVHPALSGVAHAQEPSEVAPPPRRGGTFMLIELHAGSTVPDGRTPSGALVFGTGGKVPGSPLRMYFLLEGGGDYQPDDGAARERSVWFGPGVRMYLPMFAGLRLFGEVTAGGIYQRDRVSASDRALSISKLDGQLGLGTGLQYRFSEGLSLGGRALYRVVDDGSASQLTSRQGWTLSGSATWHF